MLEGLMLAIFYLSATSILPLWIVMGDDYALFPTISLIVTTIYFMGRS